MRPCPHCGKSIAVASVGELTPRQAQCYAFIREYITTNGRSPNLVEIGEALEIRSLEAVRRLVFRVEQLGYITRRFGGRRAITLVDLRGRTRGIQKAS